MKTSEEKPQPRQAASLATREQRAVEPQPNQVGTDRWAVRAARFGAFTPRSLLPAASSIFHLRSSILALPLLLPAPLARGVHRYSTGLFLLSALCCLLFSPSAHAQFQYTTNNGTITITRYIGSGGAMTIPVTLNGLPVTMIGTRAFDSCRSLTSVTIPNSVTALGPYAFNDCGGLPNVRIPDSVTSIGDYAFGGCSGLTNITIGNNVATIAEGTFAACSGLVSVTLPASITALVHPLRRAR